MKGVFFVVLMLVLLAGSFYVIKNISTQEIIQDETYKMEAINRAKETANILNKENEKRNKRLEEIMAE